MAVCTDSLPIMSTTVKNTTRTTSSLHQGAEGIIYLFWPSPLPATFWELYSAESRLILLGGDGIELQLTDLTGSRGDVVGDTVPAVVGWSAETLVLSVSELSGAAVPLSLQSLDAEPTITTV